MYIIIAKVLQGKTVWVLTGNAVEDLDRNLFQLDPTLQHGIFNRRLPEL